METLGTEFTSAPQNHGAALRLDTASIIRKITTVKEARALPPGSIVGDQHGGLTFTDAIAAALESRSSGGWQEVQAGTETWTLIILNR